jgi:hypothetical protein
VLTYVEIATATLEPGLEDVDLEGLHDVFGVCEIELIEEIDRATAASLIIERAPTGEPAATLGCVWSRRRRRTVCSCF